MKKVSLNRLIYLRVLLLIGAIALPLFYYLYDDETNIVSLRVVFGILAFLAFILTFSGRDILEKWLYNVIYILIFLSILSIHHTFWKSSMEPVWAVYHVIIFYGLGFVFHKKSLFIIFFGIFTAFTILICLFTKDPGIDEGLFLFLFLTSAVLLFVIMHTLIWTNKEMQNSYNKIEKYAFVNAHKLRGPIARMKGLMLLVEREEYKNNAELFKYLDQSIEEVDNVIRESQILLDQE